MTSPSGERFIWLKGNVIALLTILGILIYAVFSIPATYFYAPLGTTPSEVGLSYSNIITGSTLGALIVLIFVLAFGVNIVMLIFGVFVQIDTARRAIALRKQPEVRGSIKKLNDLQFEQRLVLMRKIWKGDPADWQQTADDLRRARLLMRLEQPTRESKKEVRQIWRRVNRKDFTYLNRRLNHVLLSGYRYLYLSIAIVVAITAVLAYSAHNQAEGIIAGRSGSVGGQLQLFDYRAELIEITPSSQSDTAGEIQALEGKPLYLLGQNSQYLIIFAPGQRITVRIPVGTVIVMGLP